VTNHQLHKEQLASSDGLAESVSRLEGLKASVTEPKPFSHQDIRASNARVEHRALAAEGLYASAVPKRLLWTSMWDTAERNVEIDFYLKEQERDGLVKIDRSEPVTFALA
jgi:hypothetical protein